MASDPMLQAAAAVYGRLSGDATLMAAAPGGVWEHRAPVDVVTYPVVVFSLLPARVDYTFSGPYRWVFDLTITALDMSDAAEGAGAVIDRAVVLMQDATDTALPMTNYDVLYCRRQASNKQSPVRDGVQFQQLIDRYRLEVRPG